MPHAVLNGARLWYDDSCPEGAGVIEPLLFLHGFTAYRRMWGHGEGGAAWLLGNCVEALQEASKPSLERNPVPGTVLPSPAPPRSPGSPAVRYRCIFLEARGLNESKDAPGPYTVEQQALDVIALLDFLEIERVTFCGHSMGGGTGWVLGVNYPQRLKRLVLMAPVPAKGFPEAPGEMKSPRDSVAKHYGWLPKYTDVDESVRRSELMGDGLPADTAEWREDRARMLTSVSTEYWTQAWLSMRNLNLETKLATMTTPVLMLAGAADGLLNANIADAAQCPDAVLHVLSKSGHEVARDDPFGVAMAIHGFVTGSTKSRKRITASIGDRLKQHHAEHQAKL